MPLLMCPNDNSAMQTMNRSGVEFDMCPTCRGVWLDRGELEKLMSAAGAEFAASAVPPQPAQRPPERPPQRAYDDDRRRYDDDDYKYRHKKRRGMDIFDIFD
ncbi:MAG: zf-TFIIB domain-containing protein [Hyphomonadaceae bacterium]|nr:zf-TFIIB domain-containing protein [Hyphomonadaceae bacterium]